MTFSDTTNKNGLIQTCEVLLDLGDGGISGDSTLLKQFTNLLNIAYDEAAHEVIKNDGEWQWDDTAYTNFPIVTKDLVEGQTDYKLPAAAASNSDQTTFLRLLGVKVKDPAGNFQRIYPLDVQVYENPLETVFATAGFPKFYRLVGWSVLLYPAPTATQVSLTGGLKLDFQRDKVDFVSTDTTKQPGFPSLYHPLLAFIASKMYAGIKGMRQLSMVEAEELKFKENLGFGIANRNADQRQRLTSIQSRRNSRYE